MDPTANLAAQLRLARELADSDGAACDAGQELAELVIALDAWIRGGGFLPARWREGRNGKPFDQCV